MSILPGCAPVKGTQFSFGGRVFYWKILFPHKTFYRHERFYSAVPGTNPSGSTTANSPLPTGWSNPGKQLGTTTGSADGTPNGILPGIVVTSTGDVTDAAGVVSDPKTISVPFGVSLPLTLTRSEAKKGDGNSVRLDWATTEEVNSDFFGVEHSADSKSWKTLARVNANGDSK
ncbi:hypothetical protein [Dyadobacter sp. CY312]|uniref:hypothetical protein n=1 Tax=Dyadobacter sp. CY312 TaxID=2907303 RepID=UPI001F39E1AD|nr:hypothetical protein [Dyadobacter sp. CY312]MCE7044536.1 hypothetical protein [Dyadobacter sp. CY312]